MITFDEIISFMDTASTRMTNTIVTNASINGHNKKVRYKMDCYILHTILLLVIIIQNIGQNKKVLTN